MFKAKLRGNKGDVVLLGLTSRNVELLKKGAPLTIDLAELGMSGEVVVIYADNMHDIIDGLAPMLPPEVTKAVRAKIGPDGELVDAEGLQFVRAK